MVSLQDRIGLGGELVVCVLGSLLSLISLQDRIGLGGELVAAATEGVMVRFLRAASWQVLSLSLWDSL